MPCTRAPSSHTALPPRCTLHARTGRSLRAGLGTSAQGLLLVLHRLSLSRPPPPRPGAPPATEVAGWGVTAAQPRRAAPRSRSAAARGSTAARGPGPARGPWPWCARRGPKPGGASSAPWAGRNCRGKGRNLAALPPSSPPRQVQSSLGKTPADFSDTC